MTSIPDLFDSCLNELPFRDRSIIREYWKSKGRTRKIVVNDILFDSENASSAAYVTGIGCLHEFYFREYTQSAPKGILESLIKHELAHCFDFATHPEKHPKPDFRPSMGGFQSSAEKMMIKINEMNLRISRRYLDELAAERKNQEWGSDERELEAWLAEHKVPRK